MFETQPKSIPVQDDTHETAIPLRRRRTANVRDHLRATAVSDDELLAAILGTSSRRLTGTCLKELAQMSPDSLSAILGRKPALRLISCIELGRRILDSREERPQLKTPADIYQHLRPQLSALPREVFHVLCFNARNVLLHNVRVAEGTADACPVDPRDVFAAAVSTRASAIVLAHNHPSGCPEPSEQDRHLTQNLAAGAGLIGVRLLDHVVIGDGTYVSMLERGMIPGAGARAMAADRHLR